VASLLWCEVVKLLAHAAENAVTEFISIHFTPEGFGNIPELSFGLPFMFFAYIIKYQTYSITL